MLECFFFISKQRRKNGRKFNHTHHCGQVAKRRSKLSNEKLQNVSSQIGMLGLRSPSVVFWVGSFLFGAFGVGRFLIGDKLLGFLHLLVLIAYIIFSVVSIFSAMGDAVSQIEGNATQFQRELEQAAKAYEQGRDYTFSEPSSEPEFSEQTGVYTALMFIFAGIMWIWWFLNLFLVGRKLRRKNYEKVIQVIDNA